MARAAPSAVEQPEGSPMSASVYLDHAATSPITPAALAAMTDQLRVGGNPSSLHSGGRRARMAVETAREQIARAIGADPAEVIFTSGGTEADNLAVKGLYWKRREQDPRRRRIILSGIEHHAVKDPAQWLAAHQEAQLTWLDPDAQGFLDPESLRTLIERDPESIALISIMWANNEIGTVEPIRELARVAAEYGIPLHSDAVQAFGILPVDFRESAATALTISGHKIGAPLGVGALVARRDAPLAPVLHGGGQEREVRSGTLDAPAIAGFGAAAAEAAASREVEVERIVRLRDRLIKGVLQCVPDAVLRGSRSLDPRDRLPGNAHFTFPGTEGDSLLFLLDMAGVQSSTGSACNAGVPRPSEVLLALGLTEQEARGAQRFTLGRTSTEADVDHLLAVLPDVWEQARSAGMADHRPAGRWN